MSIALRLAVAGACAMASTSFAGDVLMNTKFDANGDGNKQDAPGSGGPFTAKCLPDGDEFITFCVEGNENFGNAEYWKEISTAAKFGGYGPTNPDPLSSGSAWLYRQVYDAVHLGKTNALTDGSVSWNDGGVQTFDITDINDLGEIQRVIWDFEGESAAGGPIVQNRFDALVALVNANVANYLEQGNLYGVRVMQLWKHPTERTWANRAQDQLIVIPMPAPVAMAAAGLVGIGVIRRRR